jgi:hypothetical protein
MMLFGNLLTNFTYIIINREVHTAAYEQYKVYQVFHSFYFAAFGYDRIMPER